jgi:hypothetical protein
MSGRTRIRLRKAAQHSTRVVSSSMTSLLLGIVVIGLLVLITAGVLSTHASKQTTGLLPLLQAQAISAVSVALLGLVAWLGFRLRFSDAKSRYLARYRLASDEPESKTSTHRFVQSVVTQLMAAKPPRSLLVVTDTGALSPELERLVPVWMVRAGLMPIVIDVSDCDSSRTVPALSRMTFVSQLAATSGDEARAERLFRREADRGKEAVVILGLNKVVGAKPRSARRSTVYALLRSSLDERLPFVAAVSEELAPILSEVAVIRVGEHGEQDLSALLETALARRGVVPSPTAAQLATAVIRDRRDVNDPWHIDVAADVVAGRVRAGVESDQAVRDAFGNRCVADLELAWLYEKATGCDPCQAGADDSGVAHTLGLVGTQAHYRQDLTTLWRDITREFSVAEELQFASGVSQLSRHGVIDVTGDAANPCLQFTHPRWLALAGAVGFGLDSDRWADLLTPGVPQPTVDALTAALLLTAARGERPHPSFLNVLSSLKKGSVGDLSLDMISAVLRALQIDGGVVVVGDEEMGALRRTWRPATDEARLLFVRIVNAQPRIARFLWDQIVPPCFDLNSYRLRRAVSAKLATMGAVAWAELERVWQELAEAAGDADLSPRARLTRTDWTRCGLPLASLAWVVPSLVDQLDGAARAQALRLLQGIGRILTEPGDQSPESRPDPGLEISLAEGYKFASVAGLGRSPVDDPPWLAEAISLLGRVRSWVSKQALQQAVALATPAGSAAANTAGADARHPFVREAVALARRAANAGAAEAPGRERRAVAVRDIWFDDVQALEDGGFSLSPEAHRLLGLSTLLINLAEGEHARAAREHRSVPEGPLTEQNARRVDARVLALTSDKLPRCFVSASHTATMLDVDCDCEFRLCGPKGQQAIGHRQISRSFAQYAETTASVRPVGQSGVAFTGRQFAAVWRRSEITSPTDYTSPSAQ